MTGLKTLLAMPISKLDMEAQVKYPLARSVTHPLGGPPLLLDLMYLSRTQVSLIPNIGVGRMRMLEEWLAVHDLYLAPHEMWGGP